MEKKIRFGDLVRNSGRPQIVTLWTAPKQNRSFNQAVKANRVLTVIQEPTRKQKDFGLIGFRERPHAAYLVFPRALPQDGNSRVIGINYDLVEEPRVAHPIGPEDLKARPAPPLKPVEKTFRVRVRRTATLETQVVVRAPNRKAAQERAVESLKSQAFEVEKAMVREEVLHVE